MRCLKAKRPARFGSFLIVRKDVDESLSGGKKEVARKDAERINQPNKDVLLALQPAKRATRVKPSVTPLGVTLGQRADKETQAHEMGGSVLIKPLPPISWAWLFIPTAQRSLALTLSLYAAACSAS